KKGDLRYVRLFYGAMLHFIEKHFSNRHSRVFAFILRAGIMGRASLSIASGAYRRLRPTVYDFLIVFTCVSGAGLVRAAFADSGMNPSFLLTVAPGYAAA